MKKIAALITLAFIFQCSYAQDDVIKQIGGRIGNFKGGGGKTADTISFVHRNDKKDSISITYKYLDSVRSIPFDSTINDFDKYAVTPGSKLYTDLFL